MVLAAAQRGAVGGKDELSLDLNDSTASKTEQHYEESIKHERSQCQDEPASRTWKHMSCYGTDFWERRTRDRDSI
jgi:hypothetical protein